MSQARQAEREIAAGTYRGPLHGIPYGAKDLLATSEGIPTTWGAAPFRDRRLDHDATVVRRLRDAGAVLAAKLAMVELAGGFGYRFPNASFTGPALNPWSRGAWTGGSSTGSAASVAAGLVPLRHRLRDLGLHPLARQHVRRRRPPAHLRSREPIRRHGPELDVGQAGPPVPHRR